MPDDERDRLVRKELDAPVGESAGPFPGAAHWGKEITAVESIQGPRVTISSRRLALILRTVEAAENRAIENATANEALTARLDALDSKGTAIAKIETVHRFGKVIVSTLFAAAITAAGGSYAYVRSSGEAAGEHRARQAQIAARQDFLQHEIEGLRLELAAAVEKLFQLPPKKGTP